jgi:hypothetical protein
MTEASLLTFRNRDYVPGVNAWCNYGAAAPSNGSMDNLAGRGLSGLLTLFLLLGGHDANAQQHAETALSPATHDGAGQQSAAGTQAPVANGGVLPRDQQPSEVPIGMTPEGLADKARANVGQTGSTGRKPAMESFKKSK